MEILIGKWIGFCSGVRRAIKLARSADSKKTVMLGPLIHNRRVVEELENSGIKITRNLEEITAGATVIIPSHGCLKEEREMLSKMEVNLIDATCPIVRNLQNLSEKLSKEGYLVVIVGDRDHPEVKGVKSYAGENSIVISEKSETRNIEGSKIAVVFQTTSSLERFREFARALSPRGKEVRIFNTLCRETVERQKEAVSLAKKNGCVIVIGGKHSANTKRIYELCKKVNDRTYHIEEPDEIEERWLKKAERIFITSGTSTPDEVVEEVIKILKEHILQRRG